jgi:hypothetical protein
LIFIPLRSVRGNCMEAIVARRGRYFLADQPLHVIQRGNNRQAIFFDDEDYVLYQRVAGRGCGGLRVRHSCLCADDQPRAPACDGLGWGLLWA